eukprot:3588811-Prymnesium_polylepis.2
MEWRVGSGSEASSGNVARTTERSALSASSSAEASFGVMGPSCSSSIGGSATCERRRLSSKRVPRALTWGLGVDIVARQRRRRVADHAHASPLVGLDDVGLVHGGLCALTDHHAAFLVGADLIARQRRRRVAVHDHASPLVGLDDVGLVHGGLCAIADHHAALLVGADLIARQRRRRVVVHNHAIPLVGLDDVGLVH